MPQNLHFNQNLYHKENLCTEKQRQMTTGRTQSGKKRYTPTSNGAIAVYRFCNRLQDVEGVQHRYPLYHPMEKMGFANLLTNTKYLSVYKFG